MDNLSLDNDNEEITQSETTRGSKGGSGGNTPKSHFLSRIPKSVSILATSIALIGSGTMYYQYSNGLSQNRQSTNYVADLRQYAERIEKVTLLVRAADINAFAVLEDSKNKIDKTTEVLLKGGRLSEQDTVIAPISGESKRLLDKVVSDFNDVKPLIANVLADKGKIAQFKDDVTKVDTELKVLGQEVVALQKKVNNGNTQEIVYLSNRISNGINNLFSSSSFTLDKGYAVVKDLRQIDAMVSMLQTGSEVYGVEAIQDPETVEILTRVKAITAKLNELAEKTVGVVGTVNNSKDAALQITMISKDLVDSAQKINESLTNDLNNLEKNKLISGILLVIAGLFGILLVASLNSRNKELESARKDLLKKQQNDNAINELIEQMSHIENGDFTRAIRVKDEFIGKIAKQMNSIRITFSNIVGKIKNTSEIVVVNTEKTDETANQLLLVSEIQSDKIVESIEKIGNITNEMDTAAQNIWIAKEESEKSKTASKDGSKLVKETIKKMDEIRYTIQESSKKIKKLGESAQSITEVTGIIQGITKQINILALNAAIQAASSGESGREFTIVAQEVQRLADDSKEATNKIESLIADIQSDTAVAIASMEKTTQEVVQGAKLTDSVGVALREIEQLAQLVAEQVTTSANIMEEKSIEMANVALEIQKVKDKSMENLEIARDVTNQNDNLKHITADLKNSISQYKVES